MGQALPFNEIDKFLKSFAGPPPGCIVDTQFLIATLYEAHTFNEEAEFMFEKFAEHKVPVYATVTTRSEFLELVRRIIMTEKLVEMTSEKSPWRITERVKQEVRRLKSWIDHEAQQERLPILRDHHIKEIKQSFMPHAHSGKVGWLDICQEFLDGQLHRAWQYVVKDLGVTYIDLSEQKAPEIIKDKVPWESMYSLSEKTSLAISDAMILNMLNHSLLPFVVSGDYDIAYAVLSEEANKTVFVPDALYRNRIKQLKFN